MARHVSSRPQGDSEGDQRGCSLPGAVPIPHLPEASRRPGDSARQGPEGGERGPCSCHLLHLPSELLTPNTPLLAHNSLRQRKADGGFRQLTPCATAGDAVATTVCLPRALQPQTAAVVVPRCRVPGRLSPRSALEGRTRAEARTRGHLASLRVLYASRSLLGGTAGEAK